MQYSIKTVLFQTIQFNISRQFKFYLTRRQTVSVASTPGQSRPRSDTNEGVLNIPQSFSITGISPSDCLVSYTGQLFESGNLPLCKGAGSVFYSPSRDKMKLEKMIHMFV